MVKDPLHGKLFVPDGVRSVILQEALEGFSKGVFVRKVDACKFLVEKGFWKKKRPGRYIDKFTALAKDSFFAGLVEYPEWGVERRVGKHQGIISEDTFNLNQKRLNGENLNKKIRVDVSSDFPLRGLLICDHCSKHLTAAWTKGRSERYPYYFCQNRPCEYYGKSISREDIEGRFTKLLKQNKLKPSVEKLVKAVFDKVWNEEIGRLQRSELLKYQEKGRLQDHAKELTKTMFKTESESLKKLYEKQLEEAAEEIEKIEDETTEKIDWKIPYRTALDKATGLLKNPYFIWKKLEPVEQHRLFYFIFEQKLPYNQIEGYRTDKVPSKIRLFESFLDENSLNVDPTGLEPATSSLFR